ncbi:MULTISPECIES: glycosyltransferase family 39 protein [unclassified Leptolyngbya]|uniref:glycosyltransferase family 39 protein n=1 Tax=unclassified Leptolyngbya TaxID=2650499 RepID=UPI0016870A82|nr:MULTISPECIES: glycosyltransferase family 39 protein [unclassified Leptolyngbya]MBD1912599.1 glycosyltransferase family 39 protein [Leptolyngbya sp. FACHB-8]MBD2158509.1 glycosyltransferase family 39 protein [Leptolyngbya sp. FACHB-16]
METPLASKPLPSIWRIILITMLVLGVFFRLVNLDGKVFWVDEAFTAMRISGYTEAEVVQAWTENPVTTVAELQRYQFPQGDRSVIGTVQGLAKFEPQLPPLYFVLTRWWVQLFGDSVSVIRSFGAIASIATLPLLALLCRELFPSRVTAYIAVCLMAVSPFQVIYAQEARPYSLWTLLTVAASWALLRALRLQTLRSWMLYGLMLTLSLYTFVYTVWVILAHGLYVLWQERRHLKSFIYSAGTAVLLFAPWLTAIALNWQSGLRLASWQRQPLENRFLALPLAWALHVTRTFLDFDDDVGLDQLMPYGLLVLLTLVGVGYALYLFRNGGPELAWRFVVLLLVVPALAIILPDLLTGGQQSTASRYFVPCWIALILIMAYALTLLLNERLGRIALAGLLTFQVLSCATSSLASTWWNKEGGYIPYVANQINQTQKPLVVSSSDWWVFSLAHDLRPETSLEIVTRPEVLPGIPMGHSDYFLYSMPEPIRNALIQGGLQIQPFEGLEQVPIQCMVPPGQQPGPCPPNVG